MKAGGEQPYLSLGDNDLADPATIGGEAARLARPAEVKQRAWALERKRLVASSADSEPFSPRPSAPPPISRTRQVTRWKP
jgi:hypothetical protein